MPEIRSFADLYDLIRERTGASRKRARSTAQRCYFDADLAYQLLGIEPSQLTYADEPGEIATDRALRDELMEQQNELASA